MNYRYNFDDNKRNKKKKILFIIIVFIFVIVFSAFFFKSSSNSVISKISGVITYPFDKMYEFVSSGINGIKGYFSNSKKLNDEKVTLQNEVNTLQMKLLESQKILDENSSLKQMLEIKKVYQHFNIKMGKIMYREHDNWTQTFKINIGTNDGVKVGKAVVHKDGLVGYVSSVEADTATVITILDPSSSVSVTISTVNEPAILKGDLNLKSQNKLSLDFIPLDANISISDMLYTSGLGSTYPASIPVGKIIEVMNNKNDMNRYAIVEPNVSIRTISEVGVIIE
ncbi:MAG: rod shape-determining protein MreC [Clostridia bacterium]|nr:rod shape-determining protein MreC [Clostridia bacterium]